MKTRLQLLRYDIIGLGINLYIPIASTCLCTLVLCLCQTLSSLTVDIVLFLVNFVLAPMSAWYTILIYQPIFDYEGGELFWVFPQSSLMLGIGRAFIFIFLYWIEIAVILCISQFFVRFNKFLPCILKHVPLLSVFYSGLAYLSIVFSKKVGTPITVVYGYILICSFLRQRIPDWLNVLVLVETNYASTIMKTLPLAAFLWLIAQDKLSRYRES